MNEPMAMVLLGLVALTFWVMWVDENTRDL